MILSFKTKAIRDLCERQEVAREKLGEEVANALHSRLADLDAAPAWLDVPDHEDYVLSGGTLRTVAIATHLLQVRVDHVKNQVVDNSDKWRNVIRVQVVDIRLP